MEPVISKKSETVSHQFAKNGISGEKKGLEKRNKWFYKSQTANNILIANKKEQPPPMSHFGGG
ncbi:MAG: hypothetical protein J6Y99_05815 [Bacteroidales bacterium]|nr:hypothetical protein [Bacteroidales bacterium]